MKTNSVSLVEPADVHLSPWAIPAFSLELLTLYVLARWGWQTGGWPLAVLAPTAFGIVWGLLLAPKAALPISRLPRQAVKLALFALVSLAAGHLWGHVPAGLLALSAAVVVLLGEVA